MQNTASITVYDLDTFKRKLQSVNKKAEKAGVSPVTWRMVGEATITKWNRTDPTTGHIAPYEVFDHYEVEVVAEEVILPGGWRLVGVIDHVENLVRTVPNEETPLSSFVDRGPVCDHCHTSRDRNETFILVGEKGSLHQVGRTCLGLFLGIDPARALDLAGMVTESMVFDEEWLGAPKSRGVDLTFFLTHCATMIRTAGWRSRTSAKESFGELRATADMALSNLVNQQRKEKDRRSGEPLWIDPCIYDEETAQAVALWLKSDAFKGKAHTSDYLTNLSQIGENGYVTEKSAGFAASAINAYHKEKEWEIKQAAERSNLVGNGYVGIVGERITTTVNKVSSAGWDSQYGYTFIHKLIDTDGNVLVWKTQTEMENGRYKVTGTVKKHDLYRGDKQTELTRCKLGLAG